MFATLWGDSRPLLCVHVFKSQETVDAAASSYASRVQTDESLLDISSAWVRAAEFPQCILSRSPVSTQTLLEQLKREYVSMQAKQNVLEKLVHAESAADMDAVLASHENVLAAKERNDLALRQAESERRAALHRVTEIVHELTLGKWQPLCPREAGD